MGRRKKPSKRRKLNRLKQVLKAQGKTQSWLSGELDVDFRTVNRIANNHYQPDVEMLYDIAKILKVDSRDLLTF